MSIKQTLLTKVGEPAVNSGNKITIVGCGSVGMACAFACLAQDVTTDIALIDVSESRLMGEKLDLQHGSLFLNNAKIEASINYDVSEGSRICIIAAGIRQNDGESRLNLVSQNIEIFKTIIPALVQYSPNAIFLVVSNPVDILTYVTWKLSNLPKSRVFGTGCMLDTSRFRYFISKRLGVSPSSVNGWIIGEHGDSSVPVWSSVNIAGVRLCDININIGNEIDKEKWIEVHRHVVEAGNEVITLKGYTNWAIGLCVSSICSSIINNTGSLFSVSTCVNGEQGIARDIFLSLPCVIDAHGITHIVKQILTPNEKEQFIASARVVLKIIDGISLHVQKEEVAPEEDNEN